MYVQETYVNFIYVHSMYDNSMYVNSMYVSCAQCNDVYGFVSCFGVAIGAGRLKVYSYDPSVSIFTYLTACYQISPAVLFCCVYSPTVLLYGFSCGRWTLANDNESTTEERWDIKKLTDWTANN